MSKLGRVPSWWKQSALDRFLNLYSNVDSRPVYFVGSGLSRAVGLPDWGECLKSLATTVDSRLGTEDHCRELSSLLASTDEFRYQNAASKLKAAFEVTEAGLWRKTLRRIFDPQTMRKVKSSLHAALSELKCQYVVTTNYDCLLEENLRETKGQDGVEVFHPWKENISLLETTLAATCVLKLHGDIRDDSSEIVIAREEYRALYGDPVRVDNVRCLQTVLRSATPLLFLGFSFDDVFFREFYGEAMRLANPENVFAVVPQFPDATEPLAIGSGSISKLGLNVIGYDPSGDFDELPHLFRYMAEPTEHDARYRRLQSVRRPTVVALYCGGTIGAKPNDAGDLDVDRKVSRFSKSLSAFSDQLLEWYSPPRTPGSEFNDDIDVVWEILDPDSQCFSENASPAYWQVLRKKLLALDEKYFQGPELMQGRYLISDVSIWELFQEERRQFHLSYRQELPFGEREFLDGFMNRYILGILVLTGTDTLSYTAAALHLGLEHLPCPIVLTGANRPPDQSETAYHSRLLAKSDSWKNLTTALLFLQIFGHRLTEVFVAFGDSVHHPINLRKRSVEAIPFSPDVIVDRSFEPFMFRNLSYESEYLFKLINGTFCNNYYPRSNMPYSAMIDDERALRHLHHIRYGALETQQSRLKPVLQFSSSIAYFAVSPAFPEIDVNAMVSANNTRIVIIEGFPSGTYPTHSGNAFSRLLYGLYERKVPLVLVTLYGIAPTQQEYVTYPVNDVQVPVLRLYGIIPETAVPLLSLIGGGITAEEWEDAGTTYEERLNLVRRTVSEYVKKYKDVFTLEMAEITDQNRSFNKWSAVQAGNEVDKNRLKMFRNRRRFNLRRLQEASDCINPDEYGKRTLFMFREDFLSLIEELAIGPFEKIGIGPEGFQGLSTIGFRLGYCVATSEAVRKRKQWSGGGLLLSELSSEKRLLCIGAAEEILHDVVAMLAIAGYADISLMSNLSEGPCRFLSLDRESIGFRVQIAKHSERGLHGELYAAQSYLAEDAMFFDSLNGPCATEIEFSERYTVYERQLRHTWMHSSRCIDWFVGGILRGSLCVIAQKIRLNKLAVRSAQQQDGAGWQRLLADAAKMRVVEGSEDRCVLEIIYR